MSTRHQATRLAALSLAGLRSGVPLKLELVDDVPAHVGTVTDHPILWRLDSAENILANKLIALVDREEPKDLVDVWGFCCGDTAVTALMDSTALFRTAAAT